MVEGSLNLASLVIALHSIGEETVTIRIEQRNSLTARGAGWTEVETGTGRRKTQSWQFVSNSINQLPGPLEISMGHRVNPARLLPPLCIILFVPGLLALWLNRRRDQSSLVSLNWILLASLLYWISAVDVTDLSAFAGTLDVSPVVGLIMGAAFFSIPPLLSAASCLIALAPRLLPGTNSWSDLSRFLKRNIGGSAAILIPLGIALVGAGMFEYGWQVGMGSMLAAYLAYRIISWQAWRWSYTEMRAVDGGEFAERVNALARKAGVPLKRIYILRNRLPRESNAFAMSGGRVAITESLLRGLNKREVDAVMAHELGHLKGRHVGAQTGLYWIFFLLAGPAVDFIARIAGLPDWTRTLPIAPLLFTLGMSYMSKRHEFSADARVAEITGDPEAKISALARLARLTNSPLDWGGIQGSILSHPSMKARVLSIARRSGLPESRALELLENPDLLDSGLARLGQAVEPASLHYALPPELENRDPVFNTTTKLRFHTNSGWVEELSIVVLLFALGYGLSRLYPSITFHDVLMQTLLFVALLPVVYWLIIRIDNWARGRFYDGLREKIGSRIADAGSEFVGLLPGPTVVRTEGCGEWDLGFLSFGADRLTYRGERADFSLTRSQIQDATLEKGPFSWSHPYRVVVHWTGGSFSLQRPGIRRSRRQSLRLWTQLQGWRDGIIVGSGDAPALPPPALPVIQGDYVPKPHVAWWVVRKCLMLTFACVIINAVAAPHGSINVMGALVPFAAPLLWFVSALPTVLARHPKRTQPIPAPPLPIEQATRS